MSKKQASVPVRPQNVPASSPAVTGAPADGEKTEVFMDMPRAGAAERLAAAELKRKAGR